MILSEWYSRHGGTWEWGSIAWRDQSCSAMTILPMSLGSGPLVRRDTIAASSLPSSSSSPLRRRRSPTAGDQSGAFIAPAALAGAPPLSPSPPAKFRWRRWQWRKFSAAPSPRRRRHDQTPKLLLLLLTALLLSLLGVVVLSLLLPSPRVGRGLEVGGGGGGGGGGVGVRSRTIYDLLGEVPGRRRFARFWRRVPFLLDAVREMCTGGYAYADRPAAAGSRDTLPPPPTPPKPGEEMAGIPDDAVNGDDDNFVVGVETTLLLGIFSSITSSGERRRDLIRETYLSSSGREGGGIINEEEDDLLGEGRKMICSLSDHMRRYEARGRRRSGCSVAYVFVVGGGGGGEATNEEGNDSARNVGTGFADLGRVKDDDIVVLSGVRENKEEDVSPSGLGLSYRSKTAAWLRYGSALSVPYGIDYIAKADPRTLLDVPELIRMVNRDLPPSPHNRRTYGGRTYVDYRLTSPFMGGEMYFMSSDLAGIVASAMTVTCGGGKGTMGKEMATDTVAVETARSTSLLSARMGSASDVDADVGAAVMLRGGGGVVGLVHCSFWLHPVSDEGQWRRLWDAAYDNAADPGERRGLPSLQAHMVPVPHWARLIMIIVCDMLELCMRAYDS